MKKRTQLEKFMEKQRAFACPKCKSMREVCHVSEGNFHGFQLTCKHCGDRTRWTVPKNQE